jgi:hypothetical protein
LCNTLGHRSEGSRLIGKGIRFPVLGQYATAPGEEVPEQPLLLLPTVDDPGDHIEVTETGVLKWITDRGKATIELLGLNERGLPDERRNVYKNTRLKLAASLHSLALGDTTSTLDSLKAEAQEIRAGRVEFSAVARRAIKDGWSAVDDQREELDPE